LGQGRVLSPASVNILTDDVLRKLGEPNAHPPVKAEEEAIWIVECIEVFCEDGELKVNVEKTKILMFKKGEELSKIKKWRLLREKVEVTNQIKYFGMILYI
jgi:hypothetical protein